MLENRFNGKVSIVLAYFLMLTTAMMPIRAAMAQNEFQQAVADANQFALELLQGRQNPQYDSNGNLIVDGQVYMSTEELTGQKGNDYLPAELNSFGSDGATIQQGQRAKSKYEEKTAETAETSAEKAYHVLRNSFGRQKPDLSNDPIWANTDQVFGNLADIAQGFANCELTTELVTTGNTYHVPQYKTCNKLPIIEDHFSIFHEYKVGVIKHHSGPTNLNSCGDGCITLWLGTVGDNYWPGSCTIYEEEMSVEVIQPSAIISAVLDYAKYDDHFQVWLNDKKIYNGPYANFPPESAGSCELSTSWSTKPLIDVLDSFKYVPQNTIVTIKNRTSVTGNGEGFARMTLHYSVPDLVYDESWSDQELIDKAFDIKKQAEDGFCQATFTCVDMPTTLDESGCGVINGIKVCESNFGSNPMSELGVSAFCRKVEVDSNCNFYQGEFCTADVNGVKTCTPIDPKSADYNQCEQYENDSTCSFIKTECVEGALAESGECYVQEDTYDCGFSVSSGIPSEQDVLRCDGQIQCIGESCYSPVRDTANGDFGEVNAYLEMLRYAQSDMECVGVPDRPYDPVSPPDRYEPVPSCAEGYYYDKDSKKCLSEPACAYDDNNFYAASHRNGIQVVLNNQVVKDEPNIPICSTIITGSQAYTCGEARKKVATDTFYEVCVNDVDEPTPNTCPSSGHELNENTGFCEVPPITGCEEGFQLIEGGDSWSVQDDVCRLETPVTYVCTNSHETYNPETGMCEGFLFDYPICEDGMSIENDICSATRTDAVICENQQEYDADAKVCSITLVNNATCSDGSNVIDNRCNELLVEEAVCPSEGELKEGVCSVTLSQPAGCPAGSSLDDGICSVSLTTEPNCENGQFDSDSGMCSETILSNAICPEGSEINDNRCSALLIESAECPSGQELSGGICSVTLTSPAQCAEGQVFTNGKCEVKSITDLVCPEGNNLENGSCVSYEIYPPKVFCAVGKLNNNQCESTEEECRYEWWEKYEHVTGQGCNHFTGEVVDLNRQTPWWDSKNMSSYGDFVYRVGRKMDVRSVEEICGYGANQKFPIAIITSYEICRVNTTVTPPTEVCDDESSYMNEDGNCMHKDVVQGECPDGYAEDNNKCVKTEYYSPLCQSGYGYNFSTNQCEKTESSNPICNIGYSYNVISDRCEKSVDVEPICKQGFSYSPIYGQCVKTTVVEPFCQSDYTYNNDLKLCTKNQVSTPLCQDGYGYNISTNKCEKTENSNPICQTGYDFNLDTKRCEKSVDAAPICAVGYSFDPVDSQCKKTVFSDPQCQTGYEYADGECVKKVVKAPTCPDDYAYSTITHQCELETNSIPKASCDIAGSSYYPLNNSCRIDTEAQASCPSLYPIWDESEGRCVSGSLSPYAKNNNKESREQMDYALAPFAELFEAFIPKAMADVATEELSDEKQHVSKETMTKYIANKFETAAESFEEQKALVAQGRAMFISSLSSESVQEEPLAYSAMSKSAPAMRSASAPEATATGGNAGTTNVQCELFKAEAMECKQAVGGMKDCCESPVAASLGDYITLTRHMMTMDAITGQVWGLENYSGVWETASTWGSATVESAWSAIQGEFVSPADIVAQSGTENVTQGLVSEMAQAIMSYTNDFLIDTFGQEVASMFFQEVGQNAAGEAVIGASPQMAAVGQAMMYCYYAYLAYVVFNLLVNIIFACTDEELDLAMKIELLSAHYIGSYCKSEVLGACVEKRKVYCSFDSPLSRIIMEQVYMQPHMGLSWGSPKNPSCAGLKIEDISKVNWDAINLDEWTGILIKTGNFIADEQLDLDRLTGSKSKLNFGKDSDARQDVLEKNTERFDNVNIDELKRDAYEDGWNKFQ
ncbi:conjugal transfer protein TraN [Vibrio navarrensis]|nr:conjugal transfer protein TraN [Vibrio navarrensis]